MSKPIKKSTRRVLIAVLIVVLLAACFVSVGVYAHYTINKPKFPMPDTTLASARELPEDKDGVFAWVTGLYNAAAAADDVEGSWHTDVKLKDYDAPLDAAFSDADKDLIAYIFEHANDDDTLKNIYPKADNVLQCKDKGVFLPDITADDVLEYTAERGRYNDDGDYVDDDWYYVTLTVDPASMDAAAITESETYLGIAGLLAPAFTAENVKITPETITYKYKISRPFDQLASLEITRGYTVEADLLPAEAYASMLPQGERSAHVTTPYQSTEKISFKHYGVHFTQSCVAHTPGDMNALPASVTVNSKATADDYKLTFEPSVDGVVEIDADGVMTVKTMYNEPFTITMTLEYDGHTYTDVLTVYLTELEVETDAQ